MSFPKNYAFALVTAISVTLAPSLHAGGAFGLFDGFSSVCGSSCDSGCCDDSGDACCDSDGCCDSDCYGSSCDSLHGNSGFSLFKCGLFDKLGCDSGCDSDCCDSACDSGCGLGLGELGQKLRLPNLNDGCGSYISLYGGLNELNDVFDDGVRGDFNDGIALGGSIGRRLNKSFRTELEASYRTNTADNISDGAVTSEISGHLYTYAAMANLYYDVHQMKFWGITPHVGTGLGIAFTEGEGDLHIDDSNFAYQFMVGTSRQFRPGITYFSEYRYFSVDDNPDLHMNSFFYGLRFDL